MKCMYQLVKDEKRKEIIDNYVRAIYKKEFKFNQKRRIWHVKNDEALLNWARGKGVNV